MGGRDSLPEHPVPIIPPIVFHDHHDLLLFPKRNDLQHLDPGQASYSKCVMSTRYAKEAHRKEERDTFFLEDAVDIFPSSASLAAKITIGL